MIWYGDPTDLPKGIIRHLPPRFRPTLALADHAVRELDTLPICRSHGRLLFPSVCKLMYVRTCVTYTMLVYRSGDYHVRRRRHPVQYL